MARPGFAINSNTSNTSPYHCIQTALSWFGTVSAPASARRNHTRCHRTHQGDASHSARSLPTNATSVAPSTLTESRPSSHEACRERRSCLGNRRCHNLQTHRPDGRLGSRQVSQSSRCDYNKTVENNNPVPRGDSKIADTEIDVM